MDTLFFEIVSRPLANLLTLLGWFTGGEIGLAILFLTLVVRVLLFPLSARIIRDQQKMREIEPEIARIRKQSDRGGVRQGEELARLFRERNIRPFRSILLTVLQLPIVFALWRVFFSLDPAALEQVRYSWVPVSPETSLDFLGVIALTKPSIPLALVAGVLQWSAQRSLTSPARASSFTSWLFPVLTTIVLISLPAALGLYLAASAFFGTLEYHLVTWKHLRQKNSSKPSLKNLA